jgi:hypothetical protein
MGKQKKTKSRPEKSPQKPAAKGKVGIAWYKRDQWQLLLNVSADRDDLEPTYAEWYKDAEKTLEKLRQAGLDVVKVNVQIEELLDWCIGQNVPVNANARSKYAADKLHQKEKRTT